MFFCEVRSGRLIITYTRFKTESLNMEYPQHVRQTHQCDSSVLLQFQQRKEYLLSVDAGKVKQLQKNCGYIRTLSTCEVSVTCCVSHLGLVTEPQDNLQSAWFSPEIDPFNNERYSIKRHELLAINRNLYKGSDNFNTRVEPHAGGTWRNFLECFGVISSVVIGGKSPGAWRVWLVIKWLRDLRILGVGGLEIYRLSKAHCSSSPPTNNMSRLKGEMFPQGVQNIYSLLAINDYSKR